ncbi:uncharacterized protein LOC123564656 [Mercenaria mercenaria]|uniref:uncharacterized protein LOC123564656 n=1 Tax=Mercenaria mercenaria TaxID=6596 RepID=UPI001E1E15F9|nr:uncharacterized protein LOC123564656 [Mercenaria mercenaria]
MTQKLTQMDRRVFSLESKLSETNSKLIEIEASRHFDSQLCDEIRSKQVDIDQMIRDETRKYTQIAKDYDNLKQENNRLSEEMLDIQSRSMRDNLLFFNFEECKVPEERKAEDCRKKLLDFFATDLGIQEAQTSIKIDRAHRVGSYAIGKIRPIVGKFNSSVDKYDIKQKINEKRGTIHIKAGDQYPKVIQERRRALIPELIKAKEANKHAVLSYDKLFIDGKRFTPDASSQ